MQLLGEKENPVWLSASHYLLFIITIIGLGIQLSIVNIQFYIEIKFVIFKNYFNIWNIISNRDCLVYLRKNKNIHLKLLNTVQLYTKISGKDNYLQK